MKTGDEPTRAIEDLLCNLLEEGRAAAPEVTGTHRFAHSRYYYTAWRTAFRVSISSEQLVMHVHLPIIPSLTITNLTCNCCV